MASDEQQIRQIMEEWRRRTAEGDVEGLLSLTADHAVFLTPGNPPITKTAFAVPDYPNPDLDAKIDWLQAALLEHLKPGPAALEALGKQRAGAVRDALLANKGLNPERIFIVAKPAEAASPAGLVRMEMKLE